MYWWTGDGFKTALGGLAKEVMRIHQKNKVCGPQGLTKPHSLVTEYLGVRQCTPFYS